MDTLDTKLDMLEQLIKGGLTPSMGAPNLMPRLKQPASPGRPRGPSLPQRPFKASMGAAAGVAPSSKKDPVAVAQQVKDKSVKEFQVKQAKEGLVFNPQGQWSLRQW